MDKGVKNTLIAVIASIMITFIGAWIQLNSRISVLEVQVQNDHNVYLNQQNKIDELMDKVTDIQIKVNHLSDVKADK